MEKLIIEQWIDERSNCGVGGVILKRDESKSLNIDFSGALDLHFTLKNYNNNPIFIIGKDNYLVYEIFDKLYNDIINGVVFEPLSNLEINRIINKCELNEQDYYQVLKNEFEKEVENKKEFKERAQELGLVVDDKIIWRSDDYPIDIAPYVLIEKLESVYKLTFGIPKVERELSSIEDYFLYDSKCISVRIRNSGSRYNYFNICFMRAYKALINLDFQNHQIHIEEYMIDKMLESGMKLERILK